MNASTDDFCVCQDTRKLLHTRLADHPPGANRRLVAFLKEDEDSLPATKQLQLINEYCSAHGLDIVSKVQSNGASGTSLETTLSHLENADGLIVSDLDRLLDKYAERGHDLRPLLHEFFCREFGKRLISVIEGIDTRSANGQRIALEMINQIKDPGSHEDWVANSAHR